MEVAKCSTYVHIILFKSYYYRNNEYYFLISCSLKMLKIY